MAFRMVIFEALDEAWSNQPRLSRARRSTRMTGASRDDARWSRGCFHLGSSAGLSPLLLGLPPGLITLWIYESIYFSVIVRESSTRKLLKNHLWESHIWHFHIIRQFLTCGFALKIGHPQIQSLAFRGEPLRGHYLIHFPPIVPGTGPPGSYLAWWAGEVARQFRHVRCFAVANWTENVDFKTNQIVWYNRRHWDISPTILICGFVERCWMPPVYGNFKAEHHGTTRFWGITGWWAVRCQVSHSTLIPSTSQRNMRNMAVDLFLW